MNEPPSSADSALGDDEIRGLERPSQNLLLYFALFSLLFGPFFFIALIPLAVRYSTLRYRFDDEGVSMSWGRLFRREVHLAYHQIQDIHLVSNVVERWLGLARIQVQTASGSAGAEMTIAGIKEHSALRDFLYQRMRGARAEPASGRAGSPPASRPTSDTGAAVIDAEAAAELSSTLRQVAAELRALRATLEGREPESGDV